MDVDPGDRAEQCGGMMEPVALEGSSPEYWIVHVCTVCKTRRRIRAAVDDDAAALLVVAQRAASQS